METEKQSSTVKPVYKRRWFKITTGLVIAFLLILVLLPRGISYGIRKTLMENGAENVTIENVDFNPFTGTLKIDELAILKANQPLLKLHRLVARVDWIPFVSKRILVTELRMDDVSLVSRTLKDGKIRIAGFLLPDNQAAKPGEKESKPWGFGLDTILLTNLHFVHHFPEQDYRLEVKGLDLRHLKSWEPGTPGNFQFNAQLNNNPVNIELTLQPFTDEIRIDGRIKVQNLKLDDFTHFAAGKITQLGGALSLNQAFKLRLKPGEYVTLQQNGTLDVQDFKLVNNEMALQQQALNWDGDISLRQNLKTHAPTIAATGKLAQQGLALVLARDNTSVKHASLNWQGKLASEKDVTASLTLDGNIQARALSVQQNKVELFNVAQADINKLDIKGLNQVLIDNIDLNKLNALTETGSKQEKKTPVTSVEKLTLTGVKLEQQKNIAIGTVTLQNADTTITRLKDKKLAVIDLLGQPAKTPADQKQEKQAAPETKTASKQEKGNIRVDNIRFTGKNRFSFHDFSVEPVFRRTLDISKLTLDKLDSSKPDQQSPLVLAGKIGKYASIDLKGYLKPFTPKPGMKLTGTLDGIDLNALTSYTARTLGYNISSGTLYAEVDVTIDNGKIDGKNKLRLNQLQVKASDPEKIKALTTQLSMPLDAALSMLRDKNNNIELNLPVTGDINDPQFNLSDVINTALGNVMKSAAMSYLTQALQPYGTVITLFKLAKKAQSAIGLDPVKFSANSAQLDTTAQDYLGKMAKLMNDRPNINIRICGIATVEDRLAIAAIETNKLHDKLKKEGKDPARAKPVIIPDDTLLLLAQKRSENIKDWLVTQHKIPPARLFTCNPEIDKDEKNKPRADLGI